MIKSSSKSQNRILAASFLISFAAVILIYALVGIAPFGDKMLIIADSEAQYTSFWNYLREVFLGRQDPVYALEKTIGGNIIGLLGYYAASPLNFLFLLFPLEHQPLAVHLIMLLKLSLCGLSLAIYFRYTCGLKKTSLIFTTAYVFCAYTVSYCWSAMWMDAVVLLPLVALGLYNISKGKKPWLYIISLCITIVSCYYMGFILCAFSVLYFIYLLYVEEDGVQGNIKRITVFSISSLCSGALSAVVLLPILLSQTDSKRIPFLKLFKNYTYETSLKVLNLICPERAAEHDSLVKYVLLVILVVTFITCVVLWWLLCTKKVSSKVKLAGFFVAAAGLYAFACVFEPAEHFVHKLIVGFTNFDEMFDGLPGIYSGLLVMVLTLAYFMMPEIPSRRRVGAAFFVAMLLISMRFYVPNLMWHGFTENNCFGYRYSFIFSFFLICLASDAFHKGRYKPLYAVVAVAFTALLIVIAYNSHPVLATGRQYVFIALSIVIMAVILCYTYSGNTKKISIALLCALHFISILYVPFVSWTNYTENTSYKEFRNYAVNTQSVKEEMQQKDEGFYRSSIDEKINAPMMFGFNGISHFSSNEEGFVVDFLHSLGVATSGNIWADGNLGKTHTLLSFFGVKYYAENNELKPVDYALPIAFLADNTVVETAFEKNTVFDNLNNLFKASYTSLNQDIFTEVESERAYYNLKAISQTDYIVDSDSSLGELVYSLNAKSTEPLYFYSKDCVYHGGELYLNGKYLEDYSLCYGWRIIPLGSFQVGEKIELTVRLDNSSELPLTDTGSFYHEDVRVLKKYYDGISSQSVISYSSTDSKIRTDVDVTTDCNRLLYTIPYDESWQILVDGIEVEPETAFGALLAVPVTAGKHSVELNYRTQGFTSGIVISAVALMFVVLWVMYDRTNKNR